MKNIELLIVEKIAQCAGESGLKKAFIACYTCWSIIN